MGRGTWAAQSVKRLTLDFGSGHDLTVCKTKPHVRLMLSAQRLLVILSLPLSLSAPPVCALSLFQNKSTLKS